MRVLLFLVAYGNVAVVGNVEIAVWALWHTICIWVWEREFPRPSEMTVTHVLHSYFFIASLAYWCLEPNMFLHISVLFISSAVPKFDKWKLKSVMEWMLLCCSQDKYLCSLNFNTQDLKQEFMYVLRWSISRWREKLSRFSKRK